MAASAEMVRFAIVDLRDQLGDGRVQFPERKELLVASFGTINRIANLHRNFDLGFCPAPDAASGRRSSRCTVTHSGCGRRSLQGTAGQG
jgi:hypothetical protein